MIFAKSAIQDAITSGLIRISSLDQESLQPASVDLRLGTNFLVPSRSMPHTAHELGRIPMDEVESDCFTLPGYGFALARTVERVWVDPSISAFVEGRSSVGRSGLFIHNAGFVDPGFEGTITLELFNALPVPVTLREGWRICQLVFMECKGESGGYRGKYQGQVGATASRFIQDMEVE